MKKANARHTGRIVSDAGTLTLKERMQPMKRRTAKTRHMLLVDMMSSL